MPWSPSARTQRPGRRVTRTRLGAALALTLAGTTLAFAAAGGASTADAATSNRATPGAYTGLGFDQCNAPSQSAMSAWTKSSPFRSVGIYISGNSRACKTQANLTPTWVSTQLAAGWQLLPIDIGPQASCSTRYPRYSTSVDPKINASTTNNYAAARAQAVAEADKSVSAASALGIVPGSGIFYDIEAWNTATSSTCNGSALAFLGAWTDELHAHGYRSGIYSSGASGVRLLDNQRVASGNTTSMPDMLWIADWNGKADVSSTYVRSDGWMPYGRVHQYQGGHNETWGGVTINIDRNYLQLGPATVPTSARGVACTSSVLNKARYPITGPHRNKYMIPTLQCRLQKAGRYRATITGKWNPATTSAVRSWQRSVHHRRQTRFSRVDWSSLIRVTGRRA